MTKLKIVNQDELKDIWQGVMPDIAMVPELDEAGCPERHRQSEPPHKRLLVAPGEQGHPLHEQASDPEPEKPAAVRAQEGEVDRHLLAQVKLHLLHGLHVPSHLSESRTDVLTYFRDRRPRGFYRRHAPGVCGLSGATPELLKEEGDTGLLPTSSS